MVLLDTLLNLSLGTKLAPQLRLEENEALVRDSNGVRVISSYATDINRLHHTVKRARSIIENYYTLVAVPRAGLRSIYTQIEELESQVKALMIVDNALVTTSPLLGLRPRPTPISKAGYGVDGTGGTIDQDCDAENLLYDLGVRVVIDTNRKSAANGEKHGKSGVPNAIPKGSEVVASTAMPGSRKLSTTTAFKGETIVASPHDSIIYGDYVSPHTSGPVYGTATLVPSLQVPEAESGKISHNVKYVHKDPYSADDDFQNTHKSAHSMNDDGPQGTKQNKAVGGDKLTTVLATATAGAPFITSTPTVIPEPAKGTENIGVIVGLVVGGLVLLCGCVIAGVYLRRRKAKNTPSSSARYAPEGYYQFD